MNGLYTDVIFKGFYQTFDQSSNTTSASENFDNSTSQLSQHSYSDEEMKDSGSQNN